MTRHYRLGAWEIRDDDTFIRIDDATYQKHFTAYLTSLGIDTRTWLQLQEDIRRISQQQFEAAKALDDPAFWLTIDDPNIYKSPHKCDPL